MVHSGTLPWGYIGEIMRVVAVDTETVRDEPWSVQIADATSSGLGAFSLCEWETHMIAVRDLLMRTDTLTVLHNAKFDLRVLNRCGIYPARSECTMQMAYLLGMPALSLKVLAYRIAGIEMRTFDEVTEEATQEKAKEYLCEVIAQEWLDPEPTIKTMKTGEVKLSFPKNIAGKVQSLLIKHMDDPTINLRKKWLAMDIAGGRGQVEESVGKMERAYLDEVDPREAEEYAKLDAEATFAIYPYLHARIEELGLQDVLERDMDIIPMVIEMEDNGVSLDSPVLEELKRDLDELTDSTQIDINYLAGKYVNPRSSQQVCALLQDMGIYTDMETSTDASVLDQYREHTIVNKIQDYRAYTKLQSTYVDGLMKAVKADGKLHTTFSTIRTETGRLASSKPNLQNIPVRTELGRRIRQAFISERRS